MDRLQDLVSLLRDAGERAAKDPWTSPNLATGLRHLGLWLIEVSEKIESHKNTGRNGTTPASAVVTAPPPIPSRPADESFTPPKILSTPAQPFKPAPAPISGPRLTELVPIDPTRAKELLEEGFGRAAPAVAPAAVASYYDALAGPDLAIVEKRCKLKVETCQFTIERNRGVREGRPIEDYRDRYEELKSRERELHGCLLWMASLELLDAEDAALEVLAHCFENLGNAAALARDAFADGKPKRDEERQSIEMLAEAQSSLRSAVARSGSSKWDADQIEAYKWLRDYTRAHSIYLDKHMSEVSLADPNGWASLRDRLAAARALFDSRRAKGKALDKATNKVKYHARLLPSAEPAERAEHWTKIKEAAEAFIAGGGAVSSDALLDPLEGVKDLAPADFELGPTLAQAFEAIEERAESSEEGEDDAKRAERPPTKDVLQVRDLLRGKRLVLVGGIRNMKAKESLERAFELDELVWESTGDHESLTRFESDVAHPNTAVVVMAIRWSSHSYEGLKALAEKYGKAYVRLPGGYNRDQVAYQILSQAGERLRETLN